MEIGTMDTEVILAVIPLIAIQVALAIYSLYDMYRRGGTRPPLPIWAWAVIVVVGQFWGPVLYFFLGRKEDY